MKAVHEVSYPKSKAETKAIQDVFDAVARLSFGWFVKVLRGKHAGKTGRVALVGRNHVRVIEDVTEIEVSLIFVY